MADHGVALRLYYDGAWQDAPAFTRSPIATKRGITRPGQDPDPADANATLDNRSEDYAPLSILSSLYGKIGQNTPAQIEADGEVLLTGEVASWVPDESTDGNDKWTTIQVAGVLQRIGRGTDPLYSALRRSIEFSDGINVLFAYWPLTDGSDATSAAAGVVDVGIAQDGPLKDMVVNDLGFSPAMAFGTIDGPVTGEKFPEFIQNSGYAGRLEGRVPSTISLALANYQFECIVRCTTQETGGGDDALPLDFTVQASPSIGRVSMVLRGEGRCVINFRDHLDAVIHTQSTPTGSAIVDGEWHHVRVVLTQQTPTTFDSSFYLDGLLIDADTGVTGNIGAPNMVRVPGALIGSSVTVPDSLSVGHVAFYLGDVSNYQAMGGYVGETSAGRFARLCLEEGITCIVIGDPDESVAMGPQRSLTLLGHFDEISRTDDALIFETKNPSGLTIRTGGSLHNQTSAVSISRRGEVVPPLKPVVGDAGIRNDVTATNPPGSSRREVQTSGPRNVQLPEDDPQGVGKYATSVAVNPSTVDALRNAAGWRINQGTYDGAWYAEVVVDLDAAPHLQPTVDALDIGDMFTLIDLPVSDSPIDQPVIIIGIANSLYDGTRRTVRFFCVPAGPYAVGVLAETTGDTDPVLGRLVPDGSTVPAGAAAGAATLSVSTPSGPLWTTAADDFPLDVIVGGQRVTITGISGASTPQTFTVATSGHVVVYAVPAGSRVEPYQPLILTQ